MSDQADRWRRELLGDTQGRQGAGHGSRDELISKTDAWCAKIREMVEERIKAGEPMKLCKEVLEFHNGKI